MPRDRLVVEHVDDRRYGDTACVSAFTAEEVALLLAALRSYRVRAIATTARRDRLVAAIERCRAEAP
jgi:hypothetical protein